MSRLSESLRSLPLRWKLGIAVGCTSTLAVLLATAAFSAYDLLSHRRAQVEQWTVVADLVAFNSQAAVVFDSEAAAIIVLETLSAQASFIGAAIYSESGQLLAELGTGAGVPDGASTPPELQPGQHYFSGDDPILERPILLDGEQVGVLRILARTGGGLSHLVGYRVVFGPVSLVAVLLALLLAFNLHGLVTRPILRLAEAARLVTEQDDLSVRVAPAGSDEVGRLTEAFNDMLGRVETQDALAAAHIQALTEGEERVHALANASYEGSVIHQDGVVLEANEAFRGMVGTAGTLVGQNLLDLIDRDARSVVRGKIAQGAPTPFEASLVGNESVIPVHVQGRPLPYQRRDAQVLCFRDLSEIRRTELALEQSERQLRQAQKMDAVGKLAAGVAHDFNNLLTVITGNGDLVMAAMGDRNPHREQIAQICKAADSAAALTSQLLAFSRQQVLNPEALEIESILEGLHSFLGRLLGESYELVLSPRNTTGRVRIDRGQMEQVLVNLVVNSRDAMPNGGKITIESGLLAHHDREHVRRHTGMSPGDYVELVITDTGAGMDEDTLPRVFEPFFTTKPAGRGTGLGLSTVYGIVKQSQGYIFATSEADQGTTFSIYLPRVQEPVTRAGTARAHSHSPAGSETILVAEDDAGVRGLVHQVLVRQGYTVLMASDGEDAVEISQKSNETIDLLLTDMVMPGIGGRTVAERLLVKRPGMAVLLMSGYTDDAIVRGSVSGTGFEFIGKPFTPDSLRARARVAGRPRAVV